MSDSTLASMSDSDWRKRLTLEEYQVLREAATEPAGSGEYDKFYPSSGHFVCRCCGAALYAAAAKFDSGSGWPAFDQCYTGSLHFKPDLAHFGTFGGRVEILCKACGGHLVCLPRIPNRPA